MGVERSKMAMDNADLVLFVCDGSQNLTDDDVAIIELCAEHEHAIALINKSDAGLKIVPSDLPFMHVIEISAKTGEGLS
jgi:tRNA modification GTPase